MPCCQVWSETTKSLSSAQRVFEVLNTVPGVDQQAGDTLAEVKGHLQMKDVCFAYPARRDAPVLQHMSLKIAPGEVVALAGASGCGKSTVAALLTRMYEPDRSRPLALSRLVSAASVCLPRQRVVSAGGRAPP